MGLWLVAVVSWRLLGGCLDGCSYFLEASECLLLGTMEMCMPKALKMTPKKWLTSRLFFFLGNHVPGICPPIPSPPIPSPFQSQGMHGAGMWGAVGHTGMQCVSCCRADGSEDRSRGALAATVFMASRARWAAPPTGPNNRIHGLQQWKDFRIVEPRSWIRFEWIPWRTHTHTHTHTVPPSACPIGAGGDHS